MVLSFRIEKQNKKKILNYASFKMSKFFWLNTHTYDDIFHRQKAYGNSEIFLLSFFTNIHDVTTVKINQSPYYGTITQIPLYSS